MPTKVAVNTSQIVINDGSSFLVTAPNGSIDDELAQGFFVRDTRLISYYEISLNRQPLVLLASSNITYHSALYQFTNPELLTVDGKFPCGRLVVTIRRDIVGGMHEDIEITNYHPEQAKFQLMLALRSDFADIFEVKAKQYISRGETETTWKDGKLATEYRNGSFQRGIIVEAVGASSTPHHANGRLFFNVVLAPGQTWHTCVNFTALAGDDVLSPQHTCTTLHQTEAGKVRDDFVNSATRLQSSNAEIMEYYQQALIDMGALRIKVEDKNKDNFWMPAAGIPWFVAVFGRDAVVASLQTMAVYHPFARGTLIQLAQLQATEVDDWRDAQPGKMLHELRHDDLTQLHKLPYTPYYGTVDTTIIWIIVLAEAYRWNADLSMLSECRVPLEKALTWIDKYGDFDGDGFVEYLTHSQKGLRNQGWKDSGDSMVYPDGSQVEPPIALCEVQGYVYAAWRSAADIYNVWGDDRAKQLNQKADALYQRFNECFWMEDEGFYCLGLDNKKQQIQSITSNPGQLLWSSIVPKERAEKLVERLFQEDMWCGWGVRTLSSKNPAYNPISYQLGSVWPHDNSVIATGLRKYGYHKEVNRVAEAIFAAASYFEAGRMPELFAGIQRQPDGFPVPYPDANIPQAWAAGSIFLLIRNILGLEADAPHKCLKVEPCLPEWLPNLELTNLHVGDATVALRFWRDGEQTRWEVADLNGELEVNDSTPGINSDG